MIILPTTSNADGLASSYRRSVLAGCASLVALAHFGPRTTRPASAGALQGDLFAFKAPDGRDLVFALALAPKPFGQPDRDPLMVRLHAGASSWTAGPFAPQDTREALSDRGRLFSGKVWGTASNGGGMLAWLIAIAIPAERMPLGTLGVWAEIVDIGGMRWRIGNPIISQLVAGDARLVRLHAELHPEMDRRVLSAAISRRIAAGMSGESDVDTQARAKHVAALILPDTLRFNPDQPNGYTFASMNGRRPDDAIDPVVRTVLAGEPRLGPRRPMLSRHQPIPLFQHDRLSEIAEVFCVPSFRYTDRQRGSADQCLRPLSLRRLAWAHGHGHDGEPRRWSLRSRHVPR